MTARIFSRARFGAAAALLVAGLAVALPWPAREPEPVNVAIMLAWDTSGVDRRDGVATVVNDLGYTIALEEMEITAYSVELIPCDEELFRQLQTGEHEQAFAVIGSAWAGHGAVWRPTRTARAHVERPLAAPGPAIAERLAVPDYAYCRAHYAIARTTEPGAQTAGNLPAEAISLRIRGRYRRGPDADWSPLSIETAVAHGVLIEIGTSPSPAGAALADGDAIILTRRLATAFNGVDFATMDSRETARQILRQVVADSSVARLARGGHPSAKCPEGDFISVTIAPRNSPYPAPELAVSCGDDTVTIESNGIPNFDFVQTTPSRLRPQAYRFEIPRSPTVSSDPAPVPLGGPIAVSVAGLPFFGPTEAPVDGWRDPVLDNLLDYCGGHTARRGDYHHHYRPECLFPDAGERAGLILGYAFDGYPVLHPYECADAACTSTYKVHSSYEYIGGADAAWESNRYVAGRGQLDRCNGMTRPDGSYAYYATDEFPYFLGCYHGVAAEKNYGPNPMGKRP